MKQSTHISFIIFDVSSPQPQFLKREPDQDEASLRSLRDLEAAFLRKLAAQARTRVTACSRTPKNVLSITLVASGETLQQEPVVTFKGRKRSEQHTEKGLARALKRAAEQPLSSDDGETDGSSDDSEEAKEEEDDDCVWAESLGVKEAQWRKSRPRNHHGGSFDGGSTDGSISTDGEADATVHV